MVIDQIVRDLASKKIFYRVPFLKLSLTLSLPGGNICKMTLLDQLQTASDMEDDSVLPSINLLRFYP